MQRRWITDWPVSDRWPHYTRANAAEVLPDPVSPLGVQFVWERGLILGWRDAYVQSGNYTIDEFDEHRPEVAAFFGGYFFINLSNVRMQAIRSPAVTMEGQDLAFFGDRTDVPPYVAHPADERPELASKALAHIGWMLTAQDYPEIEDFKQTSISLRAERPDLGALADEALVARARMTQPLLHLGFHHHGVTSSASGVAPGLLHAIGHAIGDPTIAMVVCAGIGDVDSAEPSFRMWELSRLVRNSETLTDAFDVGVAGVLDRLAQLDDPEVAAFLTEWDAFIVDFGSRGPSEWEVLSPTWETKPELALGALDRARRQIDLDSPMVRNQVRASERAAKIAEARTAIASLDNQELAAQLEGAICATNQLAFRERTKTSLVRVLHEGRMVFHELGRRHVGAGHLEQLDHIFMLLDSEIEPFIARPGSMKATLAHRYEQWLELWELEPPFIITDGDVPPLSEWQNKGVAPSAPSAAVVAGAGDVLWGVPGCPGVVRGTARVILDPLDPSALEPGDILIASVTDSAWAPLFMTAGGVVANVGGQISHAIIISRELGLPCVVSVEHATDRIPDGAVIEVDGTTGQVTIVELP